MKTIQYDYFAKNSEKVHTTDLHLGDKICWFPFHSIGPFYPLEDFPGYMGQPRNNTIREGIVISIIPDDPFPIILVENEGAVIVCSF